MSSAPRIWEYNVLEKGNFPLGGVSRASKAWTRAVGNEVQDLELFQMVTTS